MRTVILNQQFWPALGRSERGLRPIGRRKQVFLKRVRQLGNLPGIPSPQWATRLWRLRPFATGKLRTSPKWETQTTPIDEFELNSRPGGAVLVAPVSRPIPRLQHSALGQSCRFDPLPATSGFPPDISRPARLVRLVPQPDSCTAASMRRDSITPQAATCRICGTVRRAPCTVFGPHPQNT